jgi:hypothetical protein
MKELQLTLNEIVNKIEEIETKLEALKIRLSVLEKNYLNIGKEGDNE